MHRAVFSVGRVVAVVMTLAIVGLGGCGGSVYHRAGEGVPGNLSDRLAVRVHEARVSAYDAQQVFAQDAELSPQLEERADAVAWDFSRRVGSVQDVLAKLEAPDEDGAQVLTTLEKADAAVNAAVQQARSPERANAWGKALESLSEAVASADEFLKGRDTPQAYLMKKEPTR